MENTPYGTDTQKWHSILSGLSHFPEPFRCTVTRLKVMLFPGIEQQWKGYFGVMIETPKGNRCSDPHTRIMIQDCLPKGFPDVDFTCHNPRSVSQSEESNTFRRMLPSDDIGIIQRSNQVRYSVRPDIGQ
jgi:hypothetical protein